MLTSKNLQNHVRKSARVSTCNLHWDTVLLFLMNFESIEITIINLRGHTLQAPNVSLIGW